MAWLIAMLAVVVMGIAALVAGGRGQGLGALRTDRPGLNLPDGPLTAQDLAGLRFVVVPRGYAMDQVDELLERLQSQLGATPDSVIGPGSGIMGSKQLTDRRNHDGSDETSYGGWSD